MPCLRVSVRSTEVLKHCHSCMFYSSPSRYLWEDQEGVVHTIDQGEGGEQGDPLMPLLFSLGQHGALESVQRSLRDGERMLAYLDHLHCHIP